MFLKNNKIISGGDPVEQQNSQKRVISITVVAVILITGIILYLSLSHSNDNTPADVTVDSTAVPGENNKEVKSGISAKEMQGYYIDDSDGWYYDFVYAPDDAYDGTFSAGFDQTHKAAIDNPKKHYTASGKWTLENGEIKLYNDVEYQQSMWVCGDYIVDTQNYFVGDIPKGIERFNSVFTCKAGESGDTQVFNFYSDGKLIMEVIRNDGNSDSSATDELPPYQLFAGEYQVKDDKIDAKIGEVTQTFYILDDGIAKWIYHKK